MLAGERCRLVKRIRAHDRQHRAEDLLFVDAHVGLDLVEHRAAHEEAVLVALQFQAAAVDDELGAFLDAEIDVGAHLVVMRLCDERPHFGGGIGPRSNSQCPNPWLEPCH